MTKARQARGGRRSAARLAAIQALYQIAVTEASAEEVVSEFLSHRVAGENDAASLAGADETLFADVVRGATSCQGELDAMIGPVLAEGWTLERLGPTLCAILRAGTYELLARPDVPMEVVINEYINIAHAFYAGEEPAFVNGVLDRLARSLRPGEPEAASGETAGGG
jgi:N utilization substance protein B